MIFDFLTGLFAIGNAAIEAAAVAAAINGGNHSQTSFVAPEKPCFEEEQVKEKKRGILLVIMYLLLKPRMSTTEGFGKERCGKRKSRETKIH